MKDLIPPQILVHERDHTRHTMQSAAPVPSPSRPVTTAGMAAGGVCHGLARTALLTALAVATMAAGLPSRAQSIAGVTHRVDATGQHQLQLDHGQRWPADVTLREGMRRIRAVALWMQSTQADGPLSARQSRAASASIEDSVAAIVEHPPRSAGIDANLHTLLARVLAADGLEQLLDTLDLYSRYFDDPGWQPVKHNPPAGP